LGVQFAIAARGKEETKMKSFLPSLLNDTGLPQEFTALRRQFDDLARSVGRGWPSLTEVGAGTPAVNVAETDKTIEITAELPGVDEKDIKLEVEGDRVVISGEKKREREEKDKNWHVVERSYGSFRRVLALPFEPTHENVQAHFDKGVLHVTVEKPAQSKPASKTVEIKSAPPAEAAPKAS
jgi:HSP20 family protein